MALVHDKKPDLKFLRVFGALCYPINDSEDLGELKTTTNIWIFVGYAPNRKGLGPDPIPAGLLIPAPPAPAVQVPIVSAGTPSSTTIDQDASSISYSSSSSIVQPPISHQVVADGPTIEDNPFAQADNDPFKKNRMVQSHKTKNSSKPIEMITNVIKPKRWTSKGYRISPNKSSDVHEKPNTPRSCLRWKPTSRIFNIAGLRWIPTGKMFTDSTTKVDSVPQNGSNDDITNPYECDQTHHVIAGTLNSSAGLVQNPVSLTPYVPPSKKDYEILFQPLFDEYFNPLPRAVSLDPIIVAAQELLIQPVHLHQLPLIKMYHLLVLHQQIRKFNLKSLIKVLEN
ncbi:hypothetical protein Tco_0780929 [Tanacetum coccineum]